MSGSRNLAKKENSSSGRNHS